MMPPQRFPHLELPDPLAPWLWGLASGILPPCRHISRFATVFLKEGGGGGLNDTSSSSTQGMMDGSSGTVGWQEGALPAQQGRNRVLTTGY